MEKKEKKTEANPFAFTSPKIYNLHTSIQLNKYKTNESDVEKKLNVVSKWTSADNKMCL